MGKVLFHIDLNAFYANAEILRNSALADQPIAVSGISRRGVVCTASYKAREYGVRSAMPLQQAYQPVSYTHLDVYKRQALFLLCRW